MNTKLTPESIVLPSCSSRRNFLYSLGALFGSIAFTSQLSAENPLSPTRDRSAFRLPPADYKTQKAKKVILLFMEGGPGQMDTFDPKPELTRLHQSESKLSAGLETGFKFFVGSPFDFRKVGQTGIEMCNQWQ